MLPGRSAQARNSRSSWLKPLTATILSLLALCVAMPFFIWQYSSLPESPAATARQALTPLQQLQQQKSSHQAQDSVTSSPDSPGGALTAQQPQQTVSAAVLATADQVSAAQKYLHNVQHPTKRHAVPASRYIIDPEPFDMRQQHKQVKAFLDTAAFASRQSARKAHGGRGIIINAGGPHLLSSAIVTIKVLREVHNCTLPIELVWHSPSEMDPTTLSVLKAQWGPIRGVDLSQKPWPDHHRWPPTLDAAAPTAPDGSPDDGLDKLPPERASAKLRGFLYKVWSLAESSFASALLLDADNLPLINPEGLWEDASFEMYGNLFWPDFWPPGTSDEAHALVYDMVGLDEHQAADILAASKGPGMSWRAAESGQVLIDLVRHGDIAEWAVWINSFGDTVYRAVWGDKDTYALAFAVAGKAHKFNQVQVPPSGAFSWRSQSVLVKETDAKIGGWQLAGMIQFDALAQPAFLHRTMNKLSIDGEAWPVGLLTAPLSQSWIQYYLSLDSMGPTVGVPVTYAAPDYAFTALTVDLPATEGQHNPKVLRSDLQAAANSNSMLVCPTAAFKTYWQLRQHAVPIGPIPWLDTACSSHLSTLLGTLATQYSQAGFHSHPEVIAMGFGTHTGVRQGQGQGLGHSHSHNHLSIADATPVLAWAVSADAATAAASDVARTIQASYEALEWLRAHRTTFPLMDS